MQGYKWVSKGKNKQEQKHQPIHVEYFRSGGAYILILISFRASFLISFSNRSPNPDIDEDQIVRLVERAIVNLPFVRVLPPLRITFENRLFRRSRSALFIESTTT